MREAAVLLATVMVLAFLPATGLNPFIIHTLCSAFIVAMLAVSWNILGGFAGQVSFGHAAFFGLGAYGAALLSLSAGLPGWIALAGGACVAAVGAVVVIPTLRLSGVYFALAILAFAAVLKVLCSYFSFTGAAAGLINIPKLSLHVGGFNLVFYEELPNYYTALILLAVAGGFSWWLRYGGRGYMGIALAAIAEDEQAARAAGIDVQRVKILTLIASATIAGLAGAFDAFYVNFLQPDYAFSAEWSLFPLVAALIGGTRTVNGPILGAIGLYVFNELVMKQYLERGYLIVTGVLIILIMLFLRRGVLGFLEGRYATYRA